MIMDGGWEDHLHWGYLGEHVLVAGLRLDSAWSFFLASLFTIFVCASERSGVPHNFHATIQTLIPGRPPGF